MTPERLEQIEEHDSPLTANELALGWHFCPAFDGMLTSGEPTNRDTPEGLLICACGNKINPNTCITYEGEEPHGTRDTFVPPPEKLDKFGFPVRTLEQQLADLMESIDPDPLSLVVYDPNEPVPHLTDEQLTAALIKGKAEADAMDDNLVQEMQIALDSLTEEDLKPVDRPVPPIPSPQDKTIHYHNKKWWFWDETGQHRHGPYETHAECVKDFNHYCNVYLGEPEDPS